MDFCYKNIRNRYKFDVIYNGNGKFLKNFSLIPKRPGLHPGRF